MNSIFSKFELKVKCNSQEDLVDTLEKLKMAGYDVVIDSCYSTYVYNKNELGEEYD